MNAIQNKSVKSIAQAVGVAQLEPNNQKQVNDVIKTCVMVGMSADSIIEQINKLEFMVDMRDKFLGEQIDAIIDMVTALPLGSVKWSDKLHSAVLSKIETIDVTQKIVVIDDVEHRFDNAKSMTINLVYKGKPLFKWHPNYTNDADWSTKSFSAPRILGDINSKYGLFNGCYGKKSNQWVDANGVVHANWNGPIKLVVNKDDNGKSLVTYKK